MRRLHIGLKVDDIAAAVDFYSKLFGQPPTLRRDDYVKWMLDDPLVSFSVDLHGDGTPGSAHYGIQLDSDDDLARARTAVDAAGLPHGVMWELFHTRGLAGDGDDYGCDAMP